MSEPSNWKGRSRGGLLGTRIFVALINTFGVSLAYFFSRFVALYFVLTAKSTKSTIAYFRDIHGYRGIKLYRATYRNYFLFGQVLIDRIAVFSGAKTPFTYTREGYKENLMNMSNYEHGGILLSAHMGNWEIAGQKLDDVQMRFNILMFDNEVAQMKNYLSTVHNKKTYSIIAIREDMSHLVELHRAFNDRELLVMHGDRFLPGAETITKMFMGRPAKFPAGPFVMASRFGVPITPVFSFKDSKTHYHFFAREPIQVKRARKKEDLDKAIAAASDEYIRYLEEMVKRYPEQWFNFYPFWEE
jgi:predicted LPLAT superfamily acyltransferase